MSLEPILTPEEHESSKEMALKYKERIIQQEEALALKEDALRQKVLEELSRSREIIHNLVTQYWALQAKIRDYEMHEMAATEDTKPSGRWHAEVFNLSDLIKAAASNPEYEQYLQPVMPLLNKRAIKEKRTMYVPGVIAAQKVKQ